MPELAGPERKPVRVPGVGEEPRYTLEQVRTTDEGRRFRDELWAVAKRLEVSEESRTLKEIATNVADFCREIDHVLDHFTQQPAGVGAGGPESKGPGREDDIPSGPRVAPPSADSDGNQQPQGGDVCPVSQRGPDVAEGDSVQCGGVALAQLIEEYAEKAMAKCVAEGEAGNVDSEAYNQGKAHGLRKAGELLSLTQQQSSGGQEGGVEEGADRG
ncbi:MAG TPA: hypothetical protein VLC07_03215 [Solirubrobacterales bacterium]|nr:hypothetical protein [Solirubrobacterales bacterium]